MRESVVGLLPILPVFLRCYHRRILDLSPLLDWLGVLTRTLPRLWFVQIRLAAWNNHGFAVPRLNGFAA